MKYLKQILALLKAKKVVTGPERISAVLDGFSKMILELRLGVESCEAQTLSNSSMIQKLENENSVLKESMTKADIVSVNLTKLLGE